MSPQHEDPHRLKAERNEQFAEALDKSDPIRESWAVVAAFYSALHYVEQFLVRYSAPSVDHADRNAHFKVDIRIKQAYTHYSYLSSLSHDARYKYIKLPDQAYEKLARPRLTAVKQQIDHALKMAGGVSPSTPASIPVRVPTLRSAASAPDPVRPKPGMPPEK